MKKVIFQYSGHLFYVVLLNIFSLPLLGPELKLSKNEPCGADCFQLLEEVQKKSAEQASKDNTNDENSSSCNPNKVKKNSSVDSGNEASSEDSNDSTTRSSLPRNENSNSGNGSGANKKFTPTGSQSSSTETSRRGSFSEGAGGSKKGIEALKRRDSVQGSSSQGIVPQSNSIAKVKKTYK